MSMLVGLFGPIWPVSGWNFLSDLANFWLEFFYQNLPVSGWNFLIRFGQADWNFYSQIC